ncbi:MAG: NADH:ubiquinone reductase (Na(+)-transporting) subunit A [Gimesia sp.]|jgi:Na+-transporting NADH:ubiquinone oxidoreductase subunit A|uniref:Na(+)-translocating NADH-quinone reductase subunit A n=1 Tax=Gimesia maris TaxID=122 RepID=A0A3D3RBG8_9PLAN|nr:NADH:ubiquinone reductase (Na(+)-transporting) subunit A [Gimesia sp.]HCO24940.1 NADH:ubiquinone reductase (Na(+)-transporting) subunit A [Gimesia maris]|tara:strand:- start:116724 stop:118070 length:1347 start_codon:yes stop_codon:yes gene_type:complete
MITIKKGLDLPIAGVPSALIENGPAVRSVALIGPDYIGMKPTLLVEVGDTVKKGQLLFSDKKTEGVLFTAPVAGKVTEINRGAKRAFQSMVIEVEGDEEETFTSYGEGDLTSLTREQVQDNLLKSGLWTSLRTRPYSRVPSPETTPHSIFVTAIDTNPLAPPPEVVLSEEPRAFTQGLQVLKTLTTGKVFLCKAPGTNLPGVEQDFVTVEEFGGPHPAGLVGTHIHFLDPVSEKKTVWYINYQDVIAIGKLFATGQLSSERVISIAGPVVKEPKLVRTVLGANINDLVEGNLEGDMDRLISGSALSGRTAQGPFAYLGRYALQVTALKEGTHRDFLGWMGPGFNKYSVVPVFASSWIGQGKKVAFTTSTEGSKRAMIPIGTYEKVMPLDILPTFLLRALITEDTEQAKQLGCLELDEEDLSLCTFVCPGKYNYGSLLRKSLTTIEIEG